jgi:hypothetical protein
MTLRTFAVAFSFAFAAMSAAHADGITSVKVDPASTRVGDEVKITVSAEGDGTQFCGLRIEFGDGDSTDIKIASSEKQFPVTVSKRYTKPGAYTVKARGKTVTTHGRCPGSAEASVNVAAAPATAPAAAAAAGASATCPEGYTLKGKLGKAGDFTCTASKGAKAPEKVMNCGDKLEYFQTKTTLGCRKPASSEKK